MPCDYRTPTRNVIKRRLKFDWIRRASEELEGAGVSVCVTVIQGSVYVPDNVKL